MAHAFILHRLFFYGCKVYNPLGNHFAGFQPIENFSMGGYINL